MLSDILIVGGSTDNGYTGSVDLVNISGSCTKNIPDLPEVVDSHGTTYTPSGLVVSCGGWIDGPWPANYRPEHEEDYFFV